MPGRETRLAQTLIELTDTLVRDFDVVDLLVTLGERSVELFGATAAGVLLADERGELRFISAAGAAGDTDELWHMQRTEGPARDAYMAGAPIVVDDLGDTRDRWPTFTSLAVDAGFRSAQALPLRLRDRILGAFTLFGATAGRMDPADLEAAQALADAATLGILHHRAAEAAEELTDQLQAALQSRITIEQAKGILAAETGLDMAAAFAQLRSYARANQRRLADLAEDIVAGRVDGAVLRR